MYKFYCTFALSINQNNSIINNNTTIFKVMKKSFILAAILAVVSVGAAVAQPRAIGVNLGYGVDFSYQHTLSETNMIDLSVNVPMFSGIGATATYDWVNPFGTAIPWNLAGQWNWYLGVGAGAGAYHLFNRWITTSWYVGAVGHVGVEYCFDFPLQLSLDWRPNIGVEGWGSYVGFNPYGLYSGISLGVRYLF